MRIRVTVFALLAWEVAFAVNHADRFGQPEELSFPGKVTAEAELQADAKEEAGRLGCTPLSKPGYDAHGGRIEEGVRLKATGFFRLEEIDGRWWFVTPEGHRFFLIGCDACDFREGGYYTPLKDPEGREREEFAHLALPGYGEIPTLYRGPDKFNFLAWNLSRKYGADFQARADGVVRRRLADWGFNSTAKWGWGWKLKGVPYFEDAHIPDHKVCFGGWPHGLRIARGRYVDMYHPDFPAAADKAARQAAARRRNDPDLIAYAIDNENGWNHETLGWMLKAKDGDAGSFARRAFFDFVARRRGSSAEKVASDDPGRFTVDEKNGFIREASLTIHRILTAAYKRHDSNHLFMAEANSISSARAWIEGQALSPMDFIAMHEYNIESLCWYACNLDFMRAHGKPFAILEYSFTGATRGMAPYNRMTDCFSEKARGLAYRNYTEHAAQHPLCLGLGYFVMYDQPFTKRSIPGESHHFGLVSQQDRPYMDMVEEVKLSNARLFDLHAGAITDPFTLESCSGILEYEPCIMTMRRQFMPGSIPSNVTCECIRDERVALFNGNKSHLKINSDIYLTPGVNLFGTVDLSGEWRGKAFSSTFFCWNRIADAPDWPVFEERTGDGQKTRCKAKRTLLWKGNDFSMYRYELPPRDIDRQISVGIDVRDARHSWAALLAAMEVFAAEATTP